MTKNTIKIGLLTLIIILVWYFSGYYIYTHFEKTQTGSIGDLSSPINALFAGLAFSGIIMTIYLQQKELSLQRLELASTKDIFQKQKFENTFFQLSSLQQDLLNGIQHKFSIVKYTNGVQKSREELEYRGRDFFNFIENDYKELYRFINEAIEKGNVNERINGDTDINRMLHEYSIDQNFFYKRNSNYGDIDWGDDLQLTTFLYDKIFNAIQYKVSHYFRHLYSILNYIDFSKSEEIQMATSNEAKLEITKRFQQYANFLQAQLSPSELFLLFYNGLKFPKMKALIEEYDFLENLPYELLLSATHKDWYNTTMKTNTAGK